MKELSIEEKAKAYDNIIEKANKMHCENCEACQICIEELIPELAESEDEKIRKAIYNCVNWFGFDSCYFKDVTQEECLAWLERQGEQNFANSAKTCKVEQKPAWSEEDESLCREIQGMLGVCRIKELLSSNLYEKMCNWLKSLRPQNTWKPSGELDEASYQVGVKRVLENPESYGLTKYNWKPSDEQMKALKGVQEGAFRLDILESLYNDLKKLTEE